MRKLHFIRFLLFPLAVLYGLIIRIRHFWYDTGWKKSVKYDFPVICVGNLSFGGTGKTPMTEYLIRLISCRKKVTILSRGYRRKTTGLVVATQQSTAQTIGDEPFQYYRKFENIRVAVDENRVRGILELTYNEQNKGVFVLDDAFQHRKIQAGFNILLTSFESLYTDDFLLPVGTLRDATYRAKKADCIIVTKCPEDLCQEKKQQIIHKIKPLENQFVCFTSIKYATMVCSSTTEILLEQWLKFPFTLVVGIANPKPLIQYLENKGADFEIIQYPDHHHFSEKEIQFLKKKQRILTTEKDFVRLYPYLNHVFYLPIETFFIFQEEEAVFQKKILDFIH